MLKIIYYYHYYYYKESAVQGWERVTTLYQSEDPKLETTNPWKEKKEKMR